MNSLKICHSNFLLNSILGSTNKKKELILSTGVPLLQVESWESKIHRIIYFTFERNDKLLLRKNDSERSLKVHVMVVSTCFETMTFTS